MDISVPKEAITKGPDVTWQHVDGPLMQWAGNLHWLTFRERFRLFFRLATIDQIACERWPFLARTRAQLRRQDEEAALAADERTAASDDDSLTHKE